MPLHPLQLHYNEWMTLTCTQETGCIESVSDASSWVGQVCEHTLHRVGMHIN